MIAYLIICQEDGLYEEDGEDGLYEEEQIQNAVEVLLHTMTMHFVGNPSEELSSKKLILTNLRILLQHFGHNFTAN